MENGTKRLGKPLCKNVPYRKTRKYLGLEKDLRLYNHNLFEIKFCLLEPHNYPEDLCEDLTLTLLKIGAGLRYIR